MTGVCSPILYPLGSLLTCQCHLLLLLGLSGPFLDQMVKAVDSGALENASQLSLQQSLGCIRVVGREQIQSSSFPYLHGGVLCLVCAFIPQADAFLAAMAALQVFGYFGNLEICSSALKHSSWLSPGKSARDGSDLCMCRLAVVVPCAYAALQSCVSFPCRENILSAVSFSLYSASLAHASDLSLALGDSEFLSVLPHKQPPLTVPFVSS